MNWGPSMTPFLSKTDLQEPGHTQNRAWIHRTQLPRRSTPLHGPLPVKASRSHTYT